jgi:hypothetical protein
VPITAILREERDLRRRPSESSPTLRIDMPDLCQTRSVTARAPGVALRFIAGSRLVDEAIAPSASRIPATAGRRYWLQILQGTRLLASLRHYVAHRPQSGARPALWVLAPEAHSSGRGAGGPLGSPRWGSTATRSRPARGAEPRGARRDLADCGVRPR